jgi:hypothetical protein
LRSETSILIRAGISALIITPSKLVAAPSKLVDPVAPLLRKAEIVREYEGGRDGPSDGKTPGEAASWESASGEPAPLAAPAWETTAREAALCCLHTAGSIKIIRHSFKSPDSCIF